MSEHTLYAVERRPGVRDRRDESRTGRRLLTRERDPRAALEREHACAVAGVRRIGAAPHRHANQVAVVLDLLHAGRGPQPRARLDRLRRVCDLRLRGAQVLLEAFAVGDVDIDATVADRLAAGIANNSPTP